MKAEEFKSLHQQETPLLICNVWDAASAKTAESIGFSAIGTSSAAIAKMLGYNDGEEIPFEELLYLVKRIAKASSLPLTIDIEAGYSDDPVVTAQHIKSLAGVGVVGINIEDSKVEESRCIKDAEQGAKEGAKFISDHIIQATKKRFDDFAGDDIDDEKLRRIELDDCHPSFWQY